jgi:5-methylcytosine-specific restriction endonuclease McrA
MARVRRSRRARPEAGPAVDPEAHGPEPHGTEPHGTGPEPAGEVGPQGPSTALDGDRVCALCLRPIPPGVPQSLHHLIPRSKGGKGGPTVLLHHLCHKEIHAALSEAELARNFATPEALRAHPRLARFAAWVGKRPPSFLSQVPRRGRR